jgi:hypothetical protein
MELEPEIEAMGSTVLALSAFSILSLSDRQLLQGSVLVVHRSIFDLLPMRRDTSSCV